MPVTVKNISRWNVDDPDGTPVAPGATASLDLDNSQVRGWWRRHGGSFIPEAGSGGAFDGSDKWAEYNGNAVSIADTASDYLTWDTLGDGTELLDRSTPNEPTVLTAGIYAVTAAALGASMTEGGFFGFVIHLDSSNHDAVGQIESRAAFPSIGSEPVIGAACTFYIPAGGALRAQVYNYDGASARNFHLVEAIVQRLT